MTYPSISELLPHRPPMRLIDRVIAADEHSVTCETTLTPDFLFLEEKRADVLVCVELVAQTVAAFVGLRQRGEGLPPSAGFLVGCSDAEFLVPHLAEGDRLTISASHLWGGAAFGKFRGHVERHGVRIASMEVSVVRGPGEAEAEKGDPA